MPASIHPRTLIPFLIVLFFGIVGTVMVIPAGRAVAADTRTLWQDQNDWRANGGQPGDEFGTAIASGDLDGDGTIEVLIGAPGTNQVLLFPSPPLSLSPLFTFTHSADRFGSAIVVLGDVDNDGLREWAVAAPADDDRRGAVFVYSGLAATPVMTFTGSAPGAQFGFSLAAVLDSNSAPELLIGAPGVDNNTGAAYLYTLTAAISITLTGTAAGDRFGAAVASAGDLDNNGTAEIIIGAPGVNNDTGTASLYTRPLSPARAASLTLTGSTVSGRFGAVIGGSADLNGDGYPDLVVGAPGISGGAGRVSLFLGDGSAVKTTPLRSWTGNSINQSLGSALALGDLNGDGYADLAIGASGANRVQIYTGGRAGREQ